MSLIVPFEAGQRRMATKSCRRIVVHLDRPVDATRFPPRHWICTNESTGRQILVHEDEFDDGTLPATADAGHH
jgi:hypothetical protein